MDRDGYIGVMALYCLLFMALIGTNHATVVNVKTKGAKGDGVTDDGPVITRAWKEACAGASPSSLVIPPGIYLAVAIELSGPCKGPIKVIAKGATIKAPPKLGMFKKDGWITIIANTDGIHTMRLNGLNITNATIKTGDDCISFGDGSKNVYVQKSTCGPGHGFGIGSLGKYPNEEPVKGIYFRNCTLTGTANGVRIKTWAAMHPGAASDIHFEDIIMNNLNLRPSDLARHYSIHTSNYVFDSNNFGPSKVQLSNLTFRKIRGTSATQVAVKLSCSQGLPCDNVEVANINLKFKGGTATSKCSNAITKVVGPNVPDICPA
ncbi:hypothetical protein M8C21_033681 [Ambrosia artemisiifolia]|uniref:Rhamnogalacturonase A/B/Epimerase-like pectate lyase domain-containing protein n=1 Tax=Ambrosia artemisiifolia TaxID=4212 RepID=A0AAD5C3F2_AMBAR|nr:hypothetical protein M8C21_033681 [Ambrosia artemisiifolia]